MNKGDIVKATKADKSAMGAMNRPLQDVRFRLFTFIIGGGRDESAPTSVLITFQKRYSGWFIVEELN